MKTLTFFCVLFTSFSFSQNEYQKIKDLHLTNQYKKMISEIENLKLQNKPDFRYLYWDAQSKINPAVESKEIVKNIFGADTLNSEYILTKFRIIYNEYDLEDEEGIEVAQYLEKYINQLEVSDKYIAELNVLFAKYLFELGFYKESVSRSKMALKNDKKVQNGQLMMGYASIMLGKSKGAKMILKELTAHPTNPGVFYVLAEIEYFMNGIYTDQAIGYLENAKALSPEEYKYIAYLMDAYGDAGQYDKVLSLGKENLKKYDINELKFYMADAYFMMDKYQESLKVCESADKTDPTYEAVLAIAEQNYVFLEDYENALKTTLQLQGMAPEEELYKYFEAEIYYYQEEDELALQILEKEIKNGAESSMFSLMAGELYYASDDEGKALEMYSLSMEKEDIWENIYEDQLIEILALTYEDYDKETYLTNLKTIEENFESENIECIINYFTAIKENPENYEDELDEDCVKFVEVGDVE
jgi:uncharacterized protein HemY